MSVDPAAGPEAKTKPEQAPVSHCPDAPKPRRNFGAMVLTFLLMAVTWVILSGKFDPFHLSLGGISCALVAWFSSDLIFPELRLGRLILVSLRFCLYIPWLIKEVFTANLWVLYLTLHPRMKDKIDPMVIRFKSRLKSDLALVTLANSITLTPGTITINVDIDGNFEVHALDWKSASGLPGVMQDNIAKVFGE